MTSAYKVDTYVVVLDLPPEIVVNVSQSPTGATLVEVSNIVGGANHLSVVDALNTASVLLDTLK